MTNAIIMAAGTSSRFAPLSYERHKALLNVKNEVLIERQINQLLEADIKDITIVTGYKAEDFSYLPEKYPSVTLVHNSDYYRYNNTSTLMTVLDKIDDTYICSADNYFTKNVFKEKRDKAYYSAYYIDGETDEYCAEVDDENNIIGCTISGHDCFILMGHVYFSSSFSKVFVPLLKSEYENNKETRLHLWETFYLKNIDKLHFKLKEYEPGVILEFDSLKDLQDFDDTYINNCPSKIFESICKSLNIKVKDIENINTIKGNQEAIGFTFNVKDKKYSYYYEKTNALQEIT